MKKRAAIIKIPCSRISGDTPLKKIPRHAIRQDFNPEEAHILSVAYDQLNQTLLIKVEHSRFPEAYPGEELRVFWIKEALEKYPELFYRGIFEERALDI